MQPGDQGLVPHTWGPTGSPFPILVCQTLTNAVHGTAPHKGFPFLIYRCMEAVAAAAMGPLLSLHHLLKPFEMRSWEQGPDDRILPIRTLLAVCLMANCSLAKHRGAHAALAVVAIVLKDLGKLGQVSRRPDEQEKEAFLYSGR